jgi:hypothetical protein
MFSLSTLGGLFPFRLGTTSYIVQAALKTSVRAPADNVELLFFESHEACVFPSQETLCSLKSIDTVDVSNRSS